MAALCPGVQYGLSSQQNSGENKDLIFVKLTDSALRAIEEYIKNQNKFNHKPTIKFLGNENGELSFPSLHHNAGSTSFSFSMSSTADMEGPGGSFECIKQVGSPRGPLEGLGSIPHKIRIHANDDVYEVTRNRMTEAEDKYKNKCTREIKPNQTGIGRKVKVKQTNNRAPLHPVRKEMPSMRESLLKQPSYQSNAPSKPIPPIVHSSTNGLSNGLGSNHVSSSRPQLNKKPSISEMPRRPPNRKPQPPTLTPPGGSDGGSSGSGQSPTSTHPGSPPMITSSKRPGFHDGPDGFPYKRQRIAHTNKQVDQIYHQPVENNSQRRPVTDSRDASNMNPRSRESPAGAYAFANGYSNGMLNDKRNSSEDDDDNDVVSKKSSCDSHSFELSQEKTIVDSRSISPAAPAIKVPVQGREKSSERSMERQNGFMNRIVNSRVRRQEAEREVDRERNMKCNNVTSSTENRIVRVSPDSQTDSIPPVDLDPPFTSEKENEEFPDYKKEYVTIRDLDQRRKYKADFNADYAEYRDLHFLVEKVSRRFSELEERLKQEDEKSIRYKDIKKEIVREYKESKKDFEHQKVKRRFQYLHDKLSHIKRLVSEYDQEVTSYQY